MSSRYDQVELNRVLARPLPEPRFAPCSPEAASQVAGPGERRRDVRPPPERDRWRHRMCVLPGPELPIADQVAAAVSQSPAASLDAGYGARVGRALKSKVCQCLPLAVVLRSDGGGCGACRARRVYSQNGEERQQRPAFVIGRGRTSASLWKLGSRARSTCWQRVNVRSRGRHALPPREHRSCPSDGMGGQPSSLGNAVAFGQPAANIQGPWGSGPGLRRGLLPARCAIPPSQACSLAMNSRSTIRGRRPVLADRAAILPRFQHIRCGGTGPVRGRSNSTGPCGLAPQGRWMTCDIDDMGRAGHCCAPRAEDRVTTGCHPETPRCGHRRGGTRRRCADPCDGAL